MKHTYVVGTFVDSMSGMEADYFSDPYDVIEAESTKEARGIYNARHNCSFFYAEIMADIVDGKPANISKYATKAIIETALIKANFDKVKIFRALHTFYTRAEIEGLKIYGKDDIQEGEEFATAIPRWLSGDFGEQMYTKDIATSNLPASSGGVCFEPYVTPIINNEAKCPECNPADDPTTRTNGYVAGHPFVKHEGMSEEEFLAMAGLYGITVARTMQVDNDSTHTCIELTLGGINAGIIVRNKSEYIIDKHGDYWGCLDKPGDYWVCQLSDMTEEKFREMLAYSGRFTKEALEERLQTVLQALVGINRMQSALGFIKAAPLTNSSFNVCPTETK